MAKRGTHARQQWPFAVLGIFVITGFLFVSASVSADGDDLRPTGGDTGSLIKDRSQRIDDRRDQARQLRSDIDTLSKSVKSQTLDDLKARVAKLGGPMGLTSVEGPGVRVTLTDTPRDGKDPDVNPNYLVVHEQDIQAYVNALWAGGAEAISLQGQRLIATTGIKCVGNTVVLDGKPYSPPYVIEAIGDTSGMNTSIETSFETAFFAYNAQKYNLGLDIENLGKITVPGYANPVELRHAKAAS